MFDLDLLSRFDAALAALAHPAQARERAERPETPAQSRGVTDWSEVARAVREAAH
jgi:hypothetical protein